MGALVLGVLLSCLTLAPAQSRAQPACAGEPSNARLHVIVQGVRSSQGVMTATLYGDDAKKYLHTGGELKVWRVDAQAPTMEMCVWLPGPGRYAVVLYHDAKRVYHFTRGTFGPTQDYGFTRNPHLFFGPPSLNSTLISAGEGDTSTIIRLKYP